MADFDQFTSSDPPPLEDDPAADFLAREQDQLAQLDDGFDDGFGEQPPADQDQAQEPDMFAADPSTVQDQFEPPVATDGAEFDNEVLAGGGPPPLDGPPEMLDVGYDMTEEVTVGGTGDDFGFDPLADASDAQAPSPQPADPYTAFKQETPRIVPEKILRWREEQAERLTTKDQDSEIKQGEWREIAAKELEDWYKHREEQLEKTRSGNRSQAARESEAAFVHDRDEKLPGHEWEKVCRLCDFNPKSSRTTKDVARMRSILLQLKQTPLAR